MQLVNLRRVRAWRVEERLIGDVKPSYASSTRRAIPKGGREAFYIKSLRRRKKEVQEMKKTNEGKETRELNLIANKGGSGSVGFKLSIPKPWAAALGVDLNNRTVVASFDGDKIIISGIQK